MCTFSGENKDLQTKKAFGRFYQIIILFRKLSLSFHNLTQGGFLRPGGAEEAVVGELKAMGSVGSPLDSTQLLGEFYPTQFLNFPYQCFPDDLRRVESP